jgi:3-phytase
MTNVLSNKAILAAIVAFAVVVGCSNDNNHAAANTAKNDTATIQPVVVTQSLPHDTDDPAIWINPSDASKSLVLGTDKDQQGGLYVFSLDGKIDTALSVKGLQRPNNVDIEYGLLLNGKPTDIAVTTERLTHKLRIFSLPDMKAVDNGGLPVFEGETEEGYRDLMGIALYKNNKGDIYAIVGRKTGPTDDSYLWQYLLADGGDGNVTATLVRKFGKYSGKLEIEAIAVDDLLGYVYYSDEGTGVRKYYADPNKGNEELALFATTGFTADHEGISIYNATDSTGFILVSDQEVSQFHIFKREGEQQAPHQHRLVKVAKVAAKFSDGSEMTSLALNPQFKHGLFVVMNDEKNFHFYTPESILGDSLLMK